MASKPSYRPRRTRIYDANYDIGESYYKKQLDDLDNKRGIGRENRFTDQYLQSDLPRREERLTPKVSFLHEDDDDRFKSKLKSRAFFEDEDDDILTSFKPYTSRFNASDDSFFAENSKEDILKKVLDTPVKELSFRNNTDDQVNGNFTSSRRLKIKSETYSAEGKSDETSSRMKATKARLADLESEMLSLNEKQGEREKRNNNLRKLLHESTSDTFNAFEEM